MTALVRQAPRRHEVNVHPPCDTWRVHGAMRVRLPSRGRERRDRLAMTLTFLAVFGVAGFALSPVGREMACGRGPTKTQQTSRQLAEYAYEVYPAWQAEHPTRACPASLAELQPYANGRDDAWGHDLVIRCATSPEPALWVQSAGPDGALDTDDDLARWSDAADHPIARR